MFMSKLPCIPKNSNRLQVKAQAVEIDTQSRYMMLSVVSGNAYITGAANAPATSDSFLLTPGVTYEFSGKMSLISDSDGADVRILYYDVM